MSTVRVPPEARCCRCGGALGLVVSVEHVGPGVGNVEPVFVCFRCVEQQRKDVYMTHRFRAAGTREQPCR